MKNQQLVRPLAAPGRRESGQSFAEFALILILIAVVALAILLIMGDDLRVWIITAWQSIFPAQ